MTFEEHLKNIAAAAKAMDDALHQAKQAGYSVKYEVVQPNNTTQTKFTFVTLSSSIYQLM